MHMEHQLIFSMCLLDLSNFSVHSCVEVFQWRASVTLKWEGSEWCKLVFGGLLKLRNSLFARQEWRYRTILKKPGHMFSDVQCFFFYFLQYLPMTITLWLNLRWFVWQLVNITLIYRYLLSWYSELVSNELLIYTSNSYRATIVFIWSHATWWMEVQCSLFLALFLDSTNCWWKYLAF